MKIPYKRIHAFTNHLCFAGDPQKPVPLEEDKTWRGVRTKKYNYARWLNGKIQLNDLENDPLQLNNLAGQAAYADLQEEMETTMQKLMDDRGDALVSDVQYQDWFDNQRRIVRNGHGPLPHPDTEPKWSLLNTDRS